MTSNTQFELYRLFRQEKHKSIEFHLITFKHFVTLFAAILAATTAGVAQFSGQNRIVGVIALLGSLMAGMSSFLGVKTCDRFYRGVLNAVTILAKLEPALGLYARPTEQNHDHGDLPFSKDTSLLPIHLIKTCTEYDTAEAFTGKMLKRGFNRYVHLTFLGMGIVSLVGIIFGCVCLLV